MYRSLDRLGNIYKLSVIGNLNEYFGEKLRVNITGKFGAQGEKKK